MNKPNDPKLSDGGGWRGPCMAGGKAAAEARAVTAMPVRCSAWLGVAGLWENASWLSVLFAAVLILSLHSASDSRRRTPSRLRRFLGGFLECSYLILCLLKVAAKTKVLRLKNLLLRFQLRRLAVKRRKLLLRESEALTKHLGQRNALNCVGENISETHK